MSIAINTATIHKSFASILLSITPSAHVYDNPNQQNTKLPAWFIVHREPTRVEEENQFRYILTYSIDLYYLEQLNGTRTFDAYSSIADQLDYDLHYLEIYGSNGSKIHVLNREWSMELEALKYSTTLKIRVKRDEITAPDMEVIESLETFIKRYHEKERNA